VFESERFLVAGFLLLLLLVVFMGMGRTVLAVVQGAPPRSVAAGRSESPWLVAPIVALMTLVLLLGVYVPLPLADLLHEAAAYLEGKP